VILWTIQELETAVEEALANAGYQDPSNRQIRSIPDTRTIRYYTTIGLIDRPVEMRGRTALYGFRHLLQLVAIKRLQAEGESLQAIQQKLTGLPDQALVDLAQLPKEVASNAQPHLPLPSDLSSESSSLPSHSLELNESDPVSGTRDPHFWKHCPDQTTSDSVESTPLPLWIGIPLDTDVNLLLRGVAPLTAEDIQGIRQAATSLLNFLKAHRYLS
jgi:DNA-binding transcriptional MerR regulator